MSDDATDDVESNSGKDASGTDGKKKKGKLKLIVPVVVLVALAGVGYKLGPGKTPAGKPGAPTTTTTENPDDPPGEVATMDAINVNLADGKYLRVGVAVELGAGIAAKDFTVTSLPKVGDLVIQVFQGQTMEVLETPAGRDAAKAQLKKLALQTFKSDFRDLYFTDFVMQ
jgi:flagellar FliL protein